MNVTTKPKTIETLRKNRGIPIDAMAQKLKISNEEYERLEREQIELTVDEAEKIAKVFKRNWTVFLLDNPPEKPNFAHDNRLTNLQKKGIGIKTYDALEEANYLLNFIIDISNKNENKIPRYEEKVSATALAGKFRKSINMPFEAQPKFQYSTEPLSFWIIELAKAGINVSRFPLGDDDGLRAFSMYKKRKAIIVLNVDDSDNGKLFSLFHELGHILRRHTGICDFHEDEDVESYCNIFASEMLIPQLNLNEDLEHIKVDEDNAIKIASEISRKYKTSRLAVLTRFLRSGYISKSTYNQFYSEELEGYKKHKEEKLKKQKEKKPQINPYAVKRSRLGTLFTNEIFEALHNSRISPFTASNYLGFSVNKLGAFNDWVAQHTRK
jgi:Zn-dependent peptidase ImmA (M78 family)/DNA-binding XRE family transcriptional regulator